MEVLAQTLTLARKSMAVRVGSSIRAFRFRPITLVQSNVIDSVAEIFGLCVGLHHDVRFDFRVFSLVTFFGRAKKVTPRRGEPFRNIL